MENICLGFVKVLSTHYSSGFLHKCRKISMRKDRASIFCHFESCHMASMSSSFSGLLNHKMLQVP